MLVALRTDASLDIGAGHVMRCLTLADALAAQGAECQFICREHEGNLIQVIRSKGYVAHTLPRFVTAGAGVTVPSSGISGAGIDHSHWLGATPSQDAEECTRILKDLRPDWLVVDHYAIDASWERELAPFYRKLLVIDDLADRLHACDVLLDQTFGRAVGDYRSLVPDACHLLCGSEYALLRPEFAALRSYSLQRRKKPALRDLLITMGGVDKDNTTSQVLHALSVCVLPTDCRITVVMGATAPWVEEVRELAQSMPWPTRVLVGVSDMAQLMSDSDLAIGAAGATSWERCCLGLPTIALALAPNQVNALQLLERAGMLIASSLSTIGTDLPHIISSLFSNDVIVKVSKQASLVADGFGCARVTECLQRVSRG